MIRLVALFGWSDSSTENEVAHAIGAMERFDRIDEVLAWSQGPVDFVRGDIDEGGDQWDHCVSLDFDDVAAMDRFHANPLDVEVSAAMGPVIGRRMVIQVSI